MRLLPLLLAAATAGVPLRLRNTRNRVRGPFDRPSLASTDGAVASIVYGAVVLFWGAAAPEPSGSSLSPRSSGSRSSKPDCIGSWLHSIRHSLCVLERSCRRDSGTGRRRSSRPPTPLRCHSSRRFRCNREAATGRAAPCRRRCSPRGSAPVSCRRAVVSCHRCS